MKVKTNYANAPVWREVNVKSRIPESLKMLGEMARNIWWAWNNEATAVSYTHLTLPTNSRV